MAGANELEKLLLSLRGRGRPPFTIAAVERDQTHTSIFHVYVVSEGREFPFPYTATVKGQDSIVMMYGFFIDVPAQHEEDVRRLLESFSKDLDCKYFLTRPEGDPELSLTASREILVRAIPQRNEEREVIFDQIMTVVTQLQFDMYTMSHRIEDCFGITHTGDSKKRH